jgi:pimeloyl-ACP methyl ester carboxylesterase
MWGLKDPGVASGVFDLARMRSVFRDARTVTFPTAGHFVEAEQAPAAIAELSAFLSAVPAEA